MKSFLEYIETKNMMEADAPPGAPSASPGALPAPGGAPTSIPGGASSTPSGGPPPMMGGAGGPPLSLGGSGPPMGDPMAGMGAGAGQNTASTKLKAYNVWDVLEKILGTT